MGKFHGTLENHEKHRCLAQRIFPRLQYILWPRSIALSCSELSKIITQNMEELLFYHGKPQHYKISFSNSHKIIGLSVSHHL